MSRNRKRKKRKRPKIRELQYMNCRAQKLYNPELLDSPLICQLYQKANNPFLIYVLMYSILGSDIPGSRSDSGSRLLLLKSLASKAPVRYEKSKLEKLTRAIVIFQFWNICLKIVFYSSCVVHSHSLGAGAASTVWLYLKDGRLRQCISVPYMCNTVWKFICLKMIF